VRPPSSSLRPARPACRCQARTDAHHVRRNSGKANWPGFGFNILFHSIEEEIPAAHQATVLMLYRIWMFFVLVLAVNLVAAVLLTASGCASPFPSLVLLVAAAAGSPRSGADLASGLLSQRPAATSARASCTSPSSASSRSSCGVRRARALSLFLPSRLARGRPS